MNVTPGSRTPLEEAADHAIAARGAIDRAGEGARSPLRMAADALLWAIGQALAEERAGDGPHEAGRRES